MSNSKPPEHVGEVGQPLQPPFSVDIMYGTPDMMRVDQPTFIDFLNGRASIDGLVGLLQKVWSVAKGRAFSDIPLWDDPRLITRFISDAVTSWEYWRYSGSGLLIAADPETRRAFKLEHV